MSGDLSVKTGLYLPTAGGTASRLNYYEEKSFTPTLIGTSSGSVNGTGSAIRIGKLVIAFIEFAAVNTTGFAGDIRITGLPYTVSGYYLTGDIWTANFKLTAPETSLAVQAMDGQTYLAFLEKGSTTLVSWSSPGAGCYMHLTCQYQA